MEQKYSILIVDDEENITRTLARSLRDQFDIHVATSGEEALRILQEENIAVILTDQRMPGISGTELLEKAQKIRPDSLGLLISGYSDITALVDALNLGTTRGYILKPWDLDQLRAQVSKVVRQYDAVFNNRQILKDASQAVVNIKSNILELKSFMDQVIQGEIDAAALTAYLDNKTIFNQSQLSRQYDWSYLDNLMDGYAFVEANGAVPYVNPSFLQYLGLALSPQGLRLEDILQDRLLSQCAPLKDTLQTVLNGEYMLTRFQLTRPDGYLSYLELTAAPIQWQTANYNAVLVLRDQTEREKALTHLTSLSTISEIIHQYLDTLQIIESAVPHVLSAIQADGAAYYEYDMHDQRMILKYTSGISGEVISMLAENPPDQNTPSVAEVFKAGGAVATPHAIEQYPQRRELLEKEGIVSIALLPIETSTHSRGMLGFFHRTLRLYDESEMRLLNAIGHQMSLALGNASLHNALRQQSRMDTLTATANRRHFMEVTEKEFEHSQQENLPFTLLMIDIDDFKSINDSFGHLIGDSALQAVAKQINAMVRQSDLVGRYGGDEFIVMLQNCLKSEAAVVIDRIHRQTAKIQIQTPRGTSPQLRLSIGMVCLQDHPKISFEEFIAVADAEMYREKAIQKKRKPSFRH